MTVEALQTSALRAPRARFDLSGIAMGLFAAVLCLLIMLPIGWLAVFAFTDRARNPTLANFHTLFTDPAFVDPLLTTLTIATSVSLICCAVAAPLGWIVARTDMPLRGAVRILVMASFVTPPFLGAVAWELLAAPNSGLLNQLYRTVTGAGPDVALLDIYTLPGLIFVISCYTFPYIFVLVANALDRIPGDLEDASSMLGGSAWRTAMRITIPLALPALLAGALVAFLQAMTLFGSPAILALPAGFHTMTTKIWSLFQFPPKPELGAAASLPLLVLTVVLLRAQALVLGRRGYTVVGGKSGPPRPVRLGPLRWPALLLCLLALCLPVFLPYGALVNAALSRVASQPLTPSTFTLHNIYFVFFELSATKLAMKNTFLLGLMAATCGTVLALVIAYLTSRAAVTGHRVLALSCHRADRHSRHRAGRRAVPRLYARAGGAVRHVVDPAHRLRDHRAAGRLSAAAVGLPLAVARTGGGEPHPGRLAAQDAARRDSAAAGPQSGRHLVLHLRGRGARAVRRGHPVHF